MSHEKVLATVLRSVRGFMGTGPTARINVQHLHADGSEGRAGFLEGEKITGKTATPDAVADEIVEIIENDAKLWRGTNRYVVLFYRPGEREHSARCGVVVQNDKAVLRDSLEESEPANDKGLTSMAMRHMESMMTRMNNMVDMFLKAASDKERIQAEQLSQADNARIRLLQLEQDLLDRKEERHLKIAREAKTDKLVEKGVETVMMLGGPLLGKLLPGAQGQAVAADAMTIQLMASLTPEQIQALATVLTPEQGAVFLELYKSLRERYEKVKLEQQKQEQNENNGAPT
ncbi:MAG: hypothetical protein ACYCPT_02045 [Acidimicrobiales bacterium]